jgi:translation initiation factor eIF-2B subunit epsilon
MTAASPGVVVFGRSKGVNVVKELQDIYLELEETSPMENLAIELNSYKFSQIATYADCTTWRPS